MSAIDTEIREAWKSGPTPIAEGTLLCPCCTTHRPESQFPCIPSDHWQRSVFCQFCEQMSADDNNPETLRCSPCDRCRTKEDMA